MPSYNICVEADLVLRTRLECLEAKFSGQIHRAENSSGNKRVTVETRGLTELGNSGTISSLNLKNYYITNIWWRYDGEATTDTMVFSHGEEEQNEAFETILELLGDEFEEEEIGSGEEMIAINGQPRRIEVLLTMISSPTVGRKVLVLDVMNTFGPRNLKTLSGRTWKPDGTLEKFKSSGMNDAVWCIKELRRFKAEQSRPVITHIGFADTSRQIKAWEDLVAFTRSLNSFERSVLENWMPADDDDGDEGSLYGQGTHWTKRYPQHDENPNITTTKPQPAMFRVSGDNLGKIIHLSTAEKEVSRPTDERQLPLKEYLEKKAEAGSATSEVGVEVSATVGVGVVENGVDKVDTPGTDTGTSDAGDNNVSPLSRCDCGSPICTVCFAESSAVDALLPGHKPPTLP